MSHTRIITVVEKFGFGRSVKKMPISILGSEAEPKDRGKEPGYRIAIVREEIRCDEVINKSTLCHYYNDGKNNPTREGNLPFFCRDKATWAAKRIDLDAH